MELVILGLSFIFSLVLIIMGFAKKSPPLAIMGSLTLLFLGIGLWTTSIQSTVADYPFNNETLVTTTYTYGQESNIFGFLWSLFSLFILLYSIKIWLYGDSEEGG